MTLPHHDAPPNEAGRLIASNTARIERCSASVFAPSDCVNEAPNRSPTISEIIPKCAERSPQAAVSDRSQKYGLVRDQEQENGGSGFGGRRRRSV